MLASITGHVWSVRSSTTDTSTVDSTRPSRVKPQNGRSSRRTRAGPPRPHTQRLFSMNTGTEDSDTASTLASSAASFMTPWSTSSRACVRTMPTTDTVPKRTSLSARPPVRRSRRVVSDEATERG
jgi:hypothetical protein